MIRLEYGSSHYLGDKKELIAECNSIEDAFSKIMDYLEKIKFKSYYQRVILPNKEDTNKEIWVDYGSHYNFFYINSFTDDELIEWLTTPNN